MSPRAADQQTYMYYTCGISILLLSSVFIFMLTTLACGSIFFFVLDNFVGLCVAL